jgi:hypothetical protein
LTVMLQMVCGLVVGVTSSTREDVSGSLQRSNSMREGGGLDTCNRVPKDGLDVLTKLKTWFTVYGPTALRDIYEDVLMRRIGSGLKSGDLGHPGAKGGLWFPPLRLRSILVRYNQPRCTWSLNPPIMFVLLLREGRSSKTRVGAEGRVSLDAKSPL